MTDIIFVEPDKLLGKTYVSACQQAGIKTHIEPTAQDAITYIDRVRPKLIILELQLAAHNGVEFLYELRSHSDWGNIPVLLHTLIPETDLQLTDDTKKQLGIIGYLYKPQTSLQTLLSAIKGYLERAQ